MSTEKISDKDKNLLASNAQIIFESESAINSEINPDDYILGGKKSFDKLIDIISSQNSEESKIEIYGLSFSKEKIDQIKKLKEEGKTFDESLEIVIPKDDIEILKQKIHQDVMIDFVESIELKPIDSYFASAKAEAVLFFKEEHKKLKEKKDLTSAKDIHIVAKKFKSLALTENREEVVQKFAEYSKEFVKLDTEFMKFAKIKLEKEKKPVTAMSMTLKEYLSFDSKCSMFYSKLKKEVKKAREIQKEGDVELYGAKISAETVKEILDLKELDIRESSEDRNKSALEQMNNIMASIGEPANITLANSIESLVFVEDLDEKLSSLRVVESRNVVINNIKDFNKSLKNGDGVVINFQESQLSEFKSKILGEKKKLKVSKIQCIRNFASSFVDRFRKIINNNNNQSRSGSISNTQSRSTVKKPRSQSQSQSRSR